MLLSVIIPIYNVEKYLNECVTSVVRNMNNTNIGTDEYEVILVDDGSPDNSAAICDELANKYDSVRCIHKKNGGVSSARNVGIDDAKGEYVAFLDGDDFWRDTSMDKLLDTLKNESPDVLFCGFCNSDEKGKITKTEHLKYREFYGGCEPFMNCSYNRDTHLCSTVFKTDLLFKYDLKFDEKLKFSEDSFFYKSSRWFAEKMIELDFEYYVYRTNPQSVTHTRISGEAGFYKMLAIHNVVKDFVNLPQKKHVSDEELLYPYVEAAAFGNIYEIIQEYCCESVNVKRLMQLLKENNLDYALTEYKTRKISDIERKRYTSFDRHPYLTAYKIRTKNILYKISRNIIPTSIFYKIRAALLDKNIF